MKAYLSLTKNILKSNISRLTFPYKLTFAVTYRCNYKCKTCNIWKTQSKNELTFDEIKTFFQKSNRFNWIDFTGGEVWLRKDFTGIVEVALRHCRNLIMVHFPTNGYMTEQIITGVERIMKMGPSKLVISISMDGDEALNDFIRGIKGGWQRQIETYRKLHSIPGVDVVLGMTLSSYNVDQYETAFSAARKECPWLEPTDFHINIAHESSHYYKNTESEIINKDKDMIIEQVKKYEHLRGFPYTPIAFMEKRYLGHVESYIRTGITPVRCHALRSSCFIDPWGNVFPCGMYDAKVAGLRDYDFNLQTIWKLPETLKLQNEIWEYKCPQCWTPCEAYQSLFGNLIGIKNTSHNRRKAHVKHESKFTTTSSIKT